MLVFHDSFLIPFMYDKIVVVSCRVTHLGGAGGLSRPRTPFLLGYALRQAPAFAFLSSAPAVFLSSYCTNFIDCGLYKNSVKNCHAFSLHPINQYLVHPRRKLTTYSHLLIRKPFYQLRDALFPRLICYPAYVFLA